MGADEKVNGDEKDNPGVILLPPYIFLIVLGAGLALEWALPVAVLAPPFSGAQFVAGLALFALGGGFGLWGVLTFLREGTNIPPDEPALKVVTSGPYRFTRNPMYLGMLIMLLGLALIFSLEWYLLLWLPFFATLHNGVVIREEAYMEKKFGQEYSDLLKRTRRWI